ncbi:MAG: DNA polymerase III subunit gamma/tau [Holosporales bacterium]|nr:DNA polymerase III subunit gamma/tau [Holosporales bacterium]
MSGHYVVLSRKYRPKDLDDLIGQEVTAQFLRTSLDENKIPHAFLFHGIRGIGKTTTARILARCLNCMGDGNQSRAASSPCGTCKSCVALDNDNHMDIMEFDAASRTGVEDIREIIESTQYVPLLGRFKIFIIDEVHMLSKSAFNALLKTLEEPPPHVKFIFATTEMNKVPETVLSRCMTFQLNPIHETKLSAYMRDIAAREDISIEDEAADIIATEAGGSVRDALSILDQVIMLSHPSKVITTETVIKTIGGARQCDIDSILDLILAGKPDGAVQLAERIIASGCAPFTLFSGLQTALYKMIAACVKKSNSNLSNLLYLWQILLKQTENMKVADHPEHVLIAAVVILAHTASFPKIEDLMIKDTPPEGSDNLIQKILTRIPGADVSEVM